MGEVFVLIHGSALRAAVHDALSALGGLKARRVDHPRGKGESLAVAEIVYPGARKAATFTTDDKALSAVCSLAHSISVSRNKAPVAVVGGDALAPWFDGTTARPGNVRFFPFDPDGDAPSSQIAALRSYVARTIGVDGEPDPPAPPGSVAWPRGKGTQRLFRAVVQVETFVLARSAKEAERQALEHAATEITENRAGKADASEVEDLSEIPEHWLTCIPWGEEDDRTVSEIIEWGRAEAAKESEGTTGTGRAGVE